MRIEDDINTDIDYDQALLITAIKLIEKLRAKNIFPYIVKYSLPLTVYDKNAVNKFNEKTRPTITLLFNIDHSFYKEMKIKDFLVAYLPDDDV